LTEWGLAGFDAHIAYVSSFYKQKRDVFEAAMERRLAGLAEWDTPQAGMFFWCVVTSAGVFLLAHFTSGNV
jgi:tryptophan aminotransferase